MKAELTEASEINSKIENLALTEETDVDEAIPIYLKKEQKIQAYNKTMEIDIENINTFEKRNKMHTTQWKTIYEVIEEDYLKESDIFPDEKKNGRIMQMKLLIYQLR